ncbi:MAG TPA: hypothetical protein DIW31_06435 [Bacteroidales bacterium]|nr:hypothetical protein [Bacteroidales bacterium]
MDKNHKRIRKLDDEEWREVPNSEGRYFVSNYGRVKSFMINKTEGRLLTFSLVKNFRFVNLTFNGKHRTTFIHKLVANAWLPKPSDKHTIVTHLDRNLKNNHISNLQWLTPEEAGKRNGEYYKNLFSGKKLPGERHHTKLKERDIIQLKMMLEKGIPQTKIAKLFCISEMQVTRIKRGENWGDVKIPQKKL